MFTTCYIEAFNIIIFSSATQQQHHVRMFKKLRAQQPTSSSNVSEINNFNFNCSNFGFHSLCISAAVLSHSHLFSLRFVPSCVCALQNGDAASHQKLTVTTIVIVRKGFCFVSLIIDVHTQSTGFAYTSQSPHVSSTQQIIEFKPFIISLVVSLSVDSKRV